MRTEECKLWSLCCVALTSYEANDTYVWRYEKKLKDKLDDEIKLAGLVALVPEELEKHLILKRIACELSRMQRDCNARIALASNRMAKANRASHGPRVSSVILRQSQE